MERTGKEMHLVQGRSNGGWSSTPGAGSAGTYSIRHKILNENENKSYTYKHLLCVRHCLEQYIETSPGSGK